MRLRKKTRKPLNKARLIKKANRRPRPKSDLETKVEEFLQSEEIEFRSQYPISRIHADIFFPATNTVLEIQGCYWHGHSVCQPKPLSKTQTRRRQKDAKRFRFLIKAGYNILILWGCDIADNWRACVKKMRSAGGKV